MQSGVKLPWLCSVYEQCVCWSGKIEVVVVIGKCVLNVDRYVCFFLWVWTEQGGCCSIVRI